MKKRSWGKFKLYVLISYLSFHKEEEILHLTRDIIKGGADVIQLRVANKSDKEFLSIATKIKKLTCKFKIPFIINNRLDIALAIDAEGVHLGQDDLPIESARKIAPRKLIGKSTHSLKEALKAAKETADYISIGPIFHSPTKPNLSPIDLNLIPQIKKKVKIPLIAIGGINLNNIKQVLKAGVEGVAISSAITKAENPKVTTRRFKKMLEVSDCTDKKRDYNDKSKIRLSP